MKPGYDGPDFGEPEAVSDERPTLRDYFAAAAMPKVSITLGVMTVGNDFKLAGEYDIATYRKFVGEQAKLAFAYADEMLKAREAHP